MNYRQAVFAWVVVSLTSIVSPAAEEFTVILLPDTQNYSTYRPDWYEAQTQWIRDNAEAENIKFAIHMGDIVNHSTYASEWQNASNAQAILEGADPIPHTVMLGNHDFSSDGSTRNTSYYNTYFPRSRYSDQPWFGDTYDSTNDNHYSFFSAGGMDFMVLCLEPLPRQEVVTWANTVVQSHPDHRVILATHMHLNPDGERQTYRTYSNFSGRSGQDVYDELVYNNPNIFMTTCGHICYEALLPSKNATGNQVYELLSDYQRTFSDTEVQYGGGWLRMLRFVPDENRITVSSYSPTQDRYDRFNAFTIEYDMGATIATPVSRPLATLTSRWEFEADGIDSVGSNNISLSTGTTIGSGRFGNGLVFEGTTTDYAYKAVNSQLSISEAFSMATWVKYDAANSPLARIFNMREDDQNACNFGFATGDAESSALFVRIFKDNMAYHVVTDEEISRDEFHHVAFSFDDLAGPTACKKIKVWIDGEEVAVSEANHRDGIRSINTNGFFILGRTDEDLVDVVNPYDWPDAYFSGTLDEMRWYDGVLSNDQAAALLYAPLPGDANGDGFVNSADADIVANYWGQTITGGMTVGDFNGDGVVNAADASIMAANWGNVTNETNAVPEPGAMLMLFLGALVLMMRRKRPTPVPTSS